MVESREKRSILFDDIFEYVGGFGPYQVSLFLLLCLAAFLGTDTYYMNFIGYIMEYWCLVPELQNLPHDRQKYIAIPENKQGKHRSVL